MPGITGPDGEIIPPGPWFFSHPAMGPVAAAKAAWMPRTGVSYLKMLQLIPAAGKQVLP